MKRRATMIKKSAKWITLALHGPCRWNCRIFLNCLIQLFFHILRRLSELKKQASLIMLSSQFKISLDDFWIDCCTLERMGSRRSAIAWCVKNRVWNSLDYILVSSIQSNPVVDLKNPKNQDRDKGDFLFLVNSSEPIKCSETDSHKNVNSLFMFTKICTIKSYEFTFKAYLLKIP